MTLADRLAPRRDTRPAWVQRAAAATLPVKVTVAK